VIAIEINPRRLALARHNARIYGVADRIEFICGDYMQLAPTLKADVVFLAPPWGGINYNQAAMYDLDWLQPTGSELFEVTSQITPNIAMSLPRNVNTSQVIALPPLGSACQIEKNVLGGHTKSVTAYFGNLVSQ
jgi:23S rRNA G2445 N2-methylase RlmL